MQLASSRELSILATPPDILPAASAEHPDLRALLAFWEGERGGRPLPAKPRNIKQIGPLLKRVHLSDVIDAGCDFRFRLLGDAVFQCLDENQTGRLVSQHPDMAVRLRYPILMREVVRTKAAVRGLATRVTAHNKVLTDSIWLPFGHDAVEQIMGLSVLTTIEN
jgi:hypothetical protein